MVCLAASVSKPQTVERDLVTEFEGKGLGVNRSNGYKGFDV